ncbi:MAG: hypothetical protein H0U13_16725 [Gemmatimonadaceae bacterium]|nr:hypothetical protein [Gemmatimonadaceae bacterium]
MSEVARAGNGGSRKSLLSVDSSSAYALLQGRLYRRLSLEDVEQSVTVVLECDGPDEAAVRALQPRSRVELAFGNHVRRGRLEEPRFNHVGSQQLATIVISKRDSEQDGHMYDVNWGGNEPHSADEIAAMRASRLLTNKPEGPDGEFGGLEMMIRGGSQYRGIEVDKSPIPDFLRRMNRDERKTWEHLRLELVRLLILAHCADRIEHLKLSVDNTGRLVHVSFKGVRQRHANSEAYILEIDEPVDF